MASILIVDDNMDLGALLASAFAERGHTPFLQILGRDALAVLQTTALDAAIVDLHLPDIRGTEVLAALRARSVPAIAISGVFRGQPFQEQVCGEFGARALVEKPFALADVVEQVEALLGTRSPERAEVPELTLVEAVDVDPSAPDAADSARALAAEREALAKKRAELSDLPFSTRQVWQSGGASARPSTAQMRALASLGPQAQPLSGTSVPRLLGAAHQARATGELRLRRGPVIKVIWLEGGRPIYAASNVAAERFGRHAALRGLLSADDLVTVQELATREKLRTGEAMVRLGLLTTAQRVELLHDQALQIIGSTFDWQDGEHQFITRKVGKPEVVPLQLSLPAVLVAGYARLPLVRLRERVPHAQVPSPAPDPMLELHELDLSPAQARLVMAADGTKTVDDLVALGHAEERESLALLMALLELHLLEPRAASPNRRIVLV